MFSEVKSLVRDPVRNPVPPGTKHDKTGLRRRKIRLWAPAEQKQEAFTWGSYKAAEHPVLFGLQSNSTALPTGPFATGSWLETQRRYASCVTIRIQTALPSADCTTFCCQQCSFTFRKLGSSVPPTISFCLWSTISALANQ